jgi:tetratricopeptide (TPR) repeat protein
LLQLRGFFGRKPKRPYGCIFNWKRYKEAIRLNPEYADAYYSRGLAYNQQGNSRLALESFRKAAELYQRQGNQEDYQDALARIQELE